MVRRLLAALLLALLLTGCAGNAEAPRRVDKPVGSMTLRYARQFTVDYYAGGASLVTIAGEERYLLVPDGAKVPDVTDAKVLRTPLDHVYLASSGAMDPFVRLDALDAVRFTSTAPSDWSLPEAVSALDTGELLYAGRYSAPDYELLLAEGCSLALENTMILHSPATREQLEALGIPTLIERSSYEAHPLGRMEWIKLYALLVGRETEADLFFEREIAALSGILDCDPTGKSAAFFYWNPAGYVNVRRSGDYVSKMIELAGGVYVPSAAEGDGAQSSVNMQLESFYAGARDADVLIYNSNVYPVSTLDELTAANGLFADFKAVREGNVWATEQNVFQRTTAVGGMIADFHAVLSGTDSERLTYLHKLK